MKKMTLMLAVFLWVMALNVFSQDKQLSPDSVLYYQLAKNLGIPGSIADKCKSSFISIIVRVRNHKASEELRFSENTPDALKRELEKKIPVLQKTEWVKIFPEIGTKKNYNVLIPLIYYMTFDCFEKISSKEFSEIVKSAFMLQKDLRQATYILEPIVCEVSKPFH